MNETLEFVVKRPREAVFQGLTDQDMISQFAQSQQSPVKMTVEAVPDRPRTGVGSAVKVSVPGAGQPLLMETVEWDPPNRCVRTLESPDLSARVSFDFADDPAGTKVKVELKMEAKSFLFKMMLPVLAKKVASEKAALQEKIKDGIA